MFPRRCNYCYCGLMPQSQTRCIKVSPCRGRRHAVTVAGLRAWNSLPASLRDTVTFTASESCCRAVTMFIFLLRGAYKYSYLLTYMLSTQQSVTSAGNILSRLTPWNHTLDAVDKLSICWRMFEEIKSSPELLQKFLITAILTEQCAAKSRTEATVVHPDIPFKCIRVRQRLKQTSCGTVFNCLAEKTLRDITAKAKITYHNRFLRRNGKLPSCHLKLLDNSNVRTWVTILPAKIKH